jgi:hypothetical protein
VARATPPLVAYQAEAVDFYAMGVRHPDVKGEEERLGLEITTPIHTHAVLDVGATRVTAWVRSVIESRNQSGSIRHCFRSRGIQMTFPVRPDGRIWVRQRFAELLDDDAVVIVDLRTAKESTVRVPGDVKADIQVESLGRMEDGKGRSLFVNRVYWKLERAKLAPDFPLLVTSK